MRRKRAGFGYIAIVLVAVLLNVLVDRLLHGYLGDVAMVIVLTGATLLWCVVLTKFWKKQGWIR